MPFISNTTEQQKEMLAEIGLGMDDLFSDIPSDFLDKPMNLPDGMALSALERPLIRTAAAAAEINRGARCHPDAHQHQLACKMGKDTQSVKEVDADLKYNQQTAEGTGHHSGSMFVFL